MSNPTVTFSKDGATATITCTRTQAIAVAVCIEDQPLEDAQPVLQALVGSPTWQRENGEGIDGPIARNEVVEYRQSHGLPVAP